MKRRPKLKSRHKARVEKAIEYALTIESWDNLVDSRTFAFYNLGPNPSPYVLTASASKEKKVSIELVSIDSPLYTWIFFFFFNKCFSSCRNDNQVQQGYVCEDEVQEG